MAGKGDNPRNNYSDKFRNNYDSIDWSQDKSRTDKKVRRKRK